MHTFCFSSFLLTPITFCVHSGLCETDNLNKAGYTPVMLAALTAAESPDDLEVAQQLLKVGDVNARSRQVCIQTAVALRRWMN